MSDSKPEPIARLKPGLVLDVPIEWLLPGLPAMPVPMPPGVEVVAVDYERKQVFVRRVNPSG